MKIRHKTCCLLVCFLQRAYRTRPLQLYVSLHFSNCFASFYLFFGLILHALFWLCLADLLCFVAVFVSLFSCCFCLVLVFILLFSALFVHAVLSPFLSIFRVFLRCHFGTYPQVRALLPYSRATSTLVFDCKRYFWRWNWFLCCDHCFFFVFSSFCCFFCFVFFFRFFWLHCIFPFFSKNSKNKMKARIKLGKKTKHFLCENFVATPKKHACSPPL